MNLITKYILVGATVFSLGVFSPFSFAKDEGSQCDNQSFLQIQHDLEATRSYASNPDQPVHVCGKVIAYSKSRVTRSGEHGYFYLNIDNQTSIRIVNNLDEMSAPQWPWVKKGDYVEVVGRYYYDSPRRQGIDWTHKGSSRKWPHPGYVIVNGVTYN